MRPTRKTKNRSTRNPLADANCGETEDEPGQGLKSPSLRRNKFACQPRLLPPDLAFVRKDLSYKVVSGATCRMDGRADKDG